MASCLVLIDVQNGFVSERTAHIPGKIVQLLRSGCRFDHVVATQFVNTDSEESPYIRLMGWRGLLSEDSQRLHSLIAELPERVFRKQIYSCFTPEFEEYIRERNIDKLYFAGIDTDCCVLKSASDCFERNISFEVLVNYCASNGGETSHQAAITVMYRTIGGNQINKTL